MIQTSLSLSASISNLWILDTACGSHIYKSLQGLQKIRSLNKDDFELYGANGQPIQAEAVGTYILSLPSGKTLELQDYYYMPNVIRNIISIPLLLEHGYGIKAKSNYYSIFYSNKFLKNAYVDNDLFTLLLNNNIFFIDNNKKKREMMRITHISGIADLVILVSQSYINCTKKNSLILIILNHLELVNLIS